MASRKWKVAVSGDLADELLDSLPQTMWLNQLRTSVIVFVVTTDDDENDQSSQAYLMGVMEQEEGTFPDFSCREVTNAAWSLFP